MRWVSLWERGLWPCVRAPASGSGDLSLAAAQALGRAVWAQLLWVGLSAGPLLLPSEAEAGGGGAPLNGGLVPGVPGQELMGPGLSRPSAVGAGTRLSLAL